MLDGLLYDSGADSFLILENGLQMPCSFAFSCLPVAQLLVSKFVTQRMIGL